MNRDGTGQSGTLKRAEGGGRRIRGDPGAGWAGWLGSCCGDEEGSGETQGSGPGSGRPGTKIDASEARVIRPRSDTALALIVHFLFRSRARNQSPVSVVYAAVCANVLVYAAAVCG
jgi:hypothetical protein